MVRRQPGAGWPSGAHGHLGGLRGGAVGPAQMIPDLEQPRGARPDGYTRLYLWLVAHRRPVLAVTFLIAAASMVISSRIDLDEDILAILPQRDRIVDDYKY